MALSWRDELVDQLDFYWQHQARPRLAGLTDDEYRWEPVPGCWSLWPRGEAPTGSGFGAGDVVIDYVYPEPDPPPVTTIAWRMMHVAVGCLGQRAGNHFGAPPVDYLTADYPLDAAGGVAYLEAMYGRFVGGLRACDDDRLAQPAGPTEAFPDRPLAALVLHVNRECFHHLAEVALLRDLYRERAGIA